MERLTRREPENNMPPPDMPKEGERYEMQYHESCGHEYCNLEDCPEFEARTMINADRIRAMSNEELATFLDEVEFRRTIHGPGALWKNRADVLEWLCQPVEEASK